MPVLAVLTPEDGLAGAIMPLGFAAAMGTALVIDLDPSGPRYPGPASLADLVADGPRRIDLVPQRRGPAVLRNGGVSYDDAARVVAALTAGWPNVVLRLPPVAAPSVEARFVPVHVAYPGNLFPAPGRPAVIQMTDRRRPGTDAGVILPPPRPTTWRALARGTIPPPDRWIRSCRRVWEFPWTR